MEYLIRLGCILTKFFEIALLVQLDRMSAYGVDGRGFDSLTGYFFTCNTLLLSQYGIPVRLALATHQDELEIVEGMESTRCTRLKNFDLGE